MQLNDQSSGFSYFCRFFWKLSCNSVAVIRKYSLHLIFAEKSLLEFDIGLECSQAHIPPPGFKGQLPLT